MVKLPSVDTSYWREASAGTTYPALSEDIMVDVVIAGAGITGLTSAYMLKQAGYTVAVLEKDTVGGGTTGRTTGKVTSQHNLIYHDLSRRLGYDTAMIYGEANQSAVAMVEKIIVNNKIECSWKREDNYVFTADSSQVTTFQQEAEAAANLGLPAHFVTKTPLPFEVAGAVRFKNQGKMNAQKYVLGLAKAVHGGGSYVFERSHVTGIRDGQPALVRTSQAKVTARHIIVATNVPTLPLLARGGYCLLEYPTESYIVAGRSDRPLRGMYISPDKTHYSILPIQDGTRHMLLVGGESHVSGLRGNTQERYQRLADYAKQHFGITEITHRWSDRDYLAYDGIPLVGKLYPWSHNLYVASAFRKWGLANGTVAAMILRDLIVGRENPWAKTFDPNRLAPIASIPRVVVKHLVGRG